MVSFRKSSDIFFFTATNLNWIKLLADDEIKKLIVQSLKFLSNNKRVKIWGFVIMPNHIHILWQICFPHKKADVQRDFLKYTAQQIKFYLIKNNSPLLDNIIVNAKDRKYQIWERNALSFEIDNSETLLQKLNYIHKNPLQEKWNLCIHQESYFYSSYRFYETGVDDFGFLEHFSESI